MITDIVSRATPLWPARLDYGHLGGCGQRNPAYDVYVPYVLFTDELIIVGMCPGMAVTVPEFDPLLRWHPGLRRLTATSRNNAILASGSTHICIICVRVMRIYNIILWYITTILLFSMESARV